MWLHVLQVYVSFHFYFIIVCARDDIPAIDQLKKISPELRPCLLESDSFAENEGGYETLLEDCNPFERYGGYPPKFIDNYRGIAPLVSKTISFSTDLGSLSGNFHLEKKSV